jgi:hypothetical protein
MNQSLKQEAFEIRHSRHGHLRMIFVANVSPEDEPLRRALLRAIELTPLCLALPSAQDRTPALTGEEAAWWNAEMVRSAHLGLFITSGGICPGARAEIETVGGAIFVGAAPRGVEEAYIGQAVANGRMISVLRGDERLPDDMPELLVSQGLWLYGRMFPSADRGNSHYRLAA